MSDFGITNISNSYIVEKYNSFQEKKDNIIARYLANKTPNKQRADATVIGGAFGALQAILLIQLYTLSEKKNKLKKIPILKHFINKIGDQIELSRKLHPNRGETFHKFAGMYSKMLFLVASGAFLGFAADTCKTYFNTKITRKIGFSKMGDNQNSAFISGLNALSKTSAGENIIRNSIKKNTDGTIAVKFNGIDKEYKITKKEMKNAAHCYNTILDDKGEVKTFKRKYSKGDGDMLAFELAYNKLLKENTEIKNTPEEFYKIMIGQNAQVVNSKDNNLDNIDKIKNSIYIGKIMNNNSLDKDTCITVKFKQNEENKNNIYAIKEINDKEITLINPKNSYKLEKRSKDDFINNFETLYYKKLR